MSDRVREFEFLSGFLICDKPAGLTSRDVVNRVGRVMNQGLPRKRRVKVGHAGTLDPLATGVLVVSIGSATRLMSVLGRWIKVYDATFQLGMESESGDVEGNMHCRRELPMPSPASLHEASGAMRGWVQQTPPKHSAVHVDGERAYRRARAGETFTMPAREVWIGSSRVSRYVPPEFDLQLECGGGTYVRSVGMDLAKACGQVAVMSRLCRTRVGPFDLSHAVPKSCFVKPSKDALSEDEGDGETLTLDQILDSLKPIETVVGHLESVRLTDEQVRRAISGQRLGLDGLVLEAPKVGPESVPGPARLAEKDETEDAAAETIAMFAPSGQLVGLADRNRETLHPCKVFMSHRLGECEPDG